MHFDERTPAFGIRIGKHRKTWLVVKGVNRTKVRLGHYPDLSLADARKMALVALGSPLLAKEAPTFPVALKAFLAQGKWRPKSRIAIESSLRHFSWTKTIDKITHEDVATALDAIEGPSARAHALKDIRSFFNWTVPKYLAHSPCQGMKMGKQPSRTRVLSDAEIKAVWKGCESMGRFGTIVRVLILSGQRRGEIAGIEQDMIGDERVTLPPWLTKNDREHTFPLSTFGTVMLGEIPGANVFNDWQRQKGKLDEASGVTGWVLHDLRRTFATGLAALGVPIHITERLLNHVSGTQSGIISVYQLHEYWSEQVAAMNAWEKRVLSIVR
ncbi:hypothetical protein X744_22360 [Mesorhizobium sp. LNJC372A00]|nr:hypothetical protein X745_21010 [Mesorhizobium sp. LNJC374B00]ESY55975.1 hypothetical protein X744_22360 [Mesorhizobium sp. LNJC372A00]